MENCEKLLVQKDCKISGALTILNSETQKIVIVVDAENRLLGVVADGDIRRGLLRGITLNDTVDMVMCNKPVSFQYGATRGEISDSLRENKILAVPILQDDVVVGVDTLQSTQASPVRDNPVFLMAGGFGTRLRPHTDNCPKPMLNVGGRPILETIILRFIDEGFHNFFISTHHLPEIIFDHFGDGSNLNVSITYLHEEQPLGTGGALGLLPSCLSDQPLIMMNGDVMTKINLSKLLDFHIKNNASATVCVRDYEYQVPYGVVEYDGQKIIAMREKPVIQHFVNAGIYVVSPVVYKNVPKGVRADMPDILLREVNAGKDVLIFPIHEYWLDIGQPADFQRVQLDTERLNL